MQVSFSELSIEKVDWKLKVQAAADWIRQRGSLSQNASIPRAGIILGTGLGSLAQRIESPLVLPYEEIPHFPRSTAPGHRGQLHWGTLAGLPVVAMEGRYHAYEGHSPCETAFPVHVMRALGIETLIVSNAAGGMNPRFQAGDVVLVEDHLNMMAGGSPLAATSEEAEQIPGTQGELAESPSKIQATSSSACFYCQRGSPYDPQLLDQATQVARRAGFLPKRGVYVAVRGPNFETRAEYRFFRRLGGDMVGMSTVPEVLAAAECGLRVLALSTVTNVCLPDALTPTSGAAVIATADQAATKVAQIILGVLNHLR